MNLLLRISRGIDNTIDFMGRKLAWLVLLMLLIGVYNVIARYVGSAIGVNLTSNALIEAQWMLFSALFFLGASYVLRHNEHVRVDFLYGNWGPRRRAWVNLLGTILFLLPFCIVVLWVSTRPVLISWGWNPLTSQWRTWEVSPNPGGLPYAPVKSLILIGFSLLFAQGLSEIIKNVAILQGRLQSHEKTLEETFAQGALLPGRVPESTIN
ncbi:TRAP transporter small permease subunit [Candidatus Gracilibacteria bacterium]|nr:TRAP transporter small permease subunit [Candidatus Gracilibacteria bacterium]